MKNKKMMSLKSLAKDMDTPYEVCRWNLARFAEEDGLVSGQDYILSGNSYSLAPSAIIWLAERVQFRDYGIISKLVETAVANANAEQDGLAAQKLADSVAALTKARETLKKAETAVKDAGKEVDAVIKEITGQAKKAPQVVADAARKKQTWKLTKNSDLLPSLSDEEADWADRVRAAVRAKRDSLGIPNAQVYHIIYQVMRNKYGIVFEQTRKEFLEQHNLPADTAINTFRLVTYDAQLRSIFQGILGNVEEYVEKRKAS